MEEWSEETEKDPFWAPYLARFYYAMQAMFQQIRYYRYKTIPPLEDRTDEKVHEYVQTVEKNRRVLLKERMGVYTLCWYPERILEFDEWASKYGFPKGRGPNGRRSFDEFCKHLLAQESDPRHEITVSIQLLSGDTYPVTYNKAQGFPGLERALYQQYGDRFPLNHVDMLIENKSWTFKVKSGDTLPIFVHPTHPQHHYVSRRPNGRIEMVFFPYFCCRSKKMIPYSHGEVDRGRVVNTHPEQSHTRVYYQHPDCIRSYPHGLAPPQYEHLLQWKTMADLLKWINAVATWQFTPAAVESILNDFSIDPVPYKT